MTQEFNAIESFIMVQNRRGPRHTMQDYMRKYWGCSRGRGEKGEQGPEPLLWFLQEGMGETG